MPLLFQPAPLNAEPSKLSQEAIAQPAYALSPISRAILLW
jgi:hypothetical protein